GRLRARAAAARERAPLYDGLHEGTREAADASPVSWRRATTCASLSLRHRSAIRRAVATGSRLDIDLDRHRYGRKNVGRRRWRVDHVGIHPDLVAAAADGVPARDPVADRRA